METQVKISAATTPCRRLATRLVALSERLHAYHPTHCLGGLCDWFTTAAAGALDVTAALVVLASLGR